MKKEVGLNAALTETADAFDPQLPVGGVFGKDKVIPQGVEILADGNAIVRYHAPGAKSVIVRTGFSEGPVTALEKQPDGVWNAVLTRGEDKYTALFFEVDGTYAINPMAPIGWSHAHPINIINFPGEGIDYYMLRDVPHGTVARDYFYSKAYGCWKSCLVYTPPGYTMGKGNDLPVLYLQHGYGENETSWVHLGKVNWIMDNLLAENHAVPCIIVMNNGMVQACNEDGGRDWNALRIEDLLLKDCIPFIENNYRAATGKWRRAMAGLSMGSMQTSVVTLKHPDLFGYAGIFSGFLGKINAHGDEDNEHFTAFNNKEKLLGDYRLFFRCMGDRDHLDAQFKRESAMLKDKGLSPSEWLAHREVIYAGGHDWNVWRPCVRDFLSLVFK